MYFHSFTEWNSFPLVDLILACKALRRVNKLSIAKYVPPHLLQDDLASEMPDEWSSSAYDTFSLLLHDDKLPVGFIAGFKRLNLSEIIYEPQQVARQGSQTIVIGVNISMGDHSLLSLAGHVPTLIIHQVSLLEFPMWVLVSQTSWIS